MEIRTRSKLLPLVGGMTAAATAAGGLAAVAHVAPAGAADSSAASALGASSLLGGGAMESCEAYFGSYGKADGAMELVEFDVADVDGADGADHAVDMDGDGDTDVVLVIDYEEAGEIECVPYELTEEMWDAIHESFPFLVPDYPGPGHYVYPSVNLPVEGDQPVAVGFRVAGIPGEHTLVSPEGVEDLASSFVDLDALFTDGVLDPRLPAYVEAEAGPDAAEAIAAAFTTCYEEGEPDFTDTDLQAGAAVLLELIGADTDPATLECSGVGILIASSSYVLALMDSMANVEEIRLSVTEEPAAPPAAAPVVVTPTFTG